MITISEKAIKNLRQKGMTCEEIAEVTELDRSMVSAALKRAELMEKSQKRQAEFMELRALGLSNEEIAKAKKVTSRTVIQQIGTQPKEITRLNARYAAKKRMLNRECQTERIRLALSMTESKTVAM